MDETYMYVISFASQISLTRIECPVLLYLHRGFLLEALKDNPQNPLAGKYGNSVRFCYESSRHLGDCVMSIGNNAPHIATRMSPWFAAALMSCVSHLLILQEYKLTILPAFRS